MAIVMLSSACTESVNDQDVVVVDPVKQEQGASYWGNKINDPYSVDNMRRAYAELVKDKESSLSKAGVSIEQIMPTHLYLKFIPKNSEEWKILQKDSVLDVVPFPLDYDLEGVSGVFRDPDCPKDQPTYQYSVVGLGYPLPEIEYIVIDSLYMPFESELSKSGNEFPFWKELELESVKLTGNFSEDDVVPMSLSKRYHPDGKVTYDDAVRGEVGVPDAKVVVHYSTHKHSCQTKADGSFRIDETFSFKVKYKVLFQNDDFSVCETSMNSVIFSSGDKGVVCNDFNINTDKLKSAAATHVAGYEFFHNDKGIITDHDSALSSHFSDNDQFGHDIITFHWNRLSAQINAPSYDNIAKMYGSAIYIWAGFVLEKQKGRSINDDDLSRAWCEGMAWFFSKDIYRNYYRDRNCLVRDLIDNDYDSNDKVCISVNTVYNCVLRSNTLDDFKNELKKQCATNSEKNNIEELFNYWKNK